MKDDSVGGTSVNRLLRAAWILREQTEPWMACAWCMLDLLFTRRPLFFFFLIEVLLTQLYYEYKMQTTQLSQTREAWPSGKGVSPCRRRREITLNYDTPPALFLNWESKQKEIKLKFLLVVFGFLKQYLFYTEVVIFTSLPFKDRFFHKLWSELNLKNKTLKVFSSLRWKKKEVLQFTLLPFVMKRANDFYKSIIHKK